MVASVPELQGIAPEQMNVALQLIEKQNPEKAQAIRQHLGKIEYLFNIAQQAKAEQAKLEDQNNCAMAGVAKTGVRQVGRLRREAGNR